MASDKRCVCPCHTHSGTYPPPCNVCGHDTREGRWVGGYRGWWEPNNDPRDEQIARLTALLERAVRAERLSAELLRNLEAANDQISRLQECVGLFNSMILSGESHSETSRARMRAALAGSREQSAGDGA